MAKTNNLTDFLTDLADAIRTKKGITERINPQDFSAEIASIESGGGDSEFAFDFESIGYTADNSNVSSFFCKCYCLFQEQSREFYNWQC